jgi:large subunit ribosomal protein L18e
LVVLLSLRRARRRAVSHALLRVLGCQLYEFLSRRTGASFNRVVLKRLVMSKTNRPPMGLARVLRYAKGSEGKIAVVVGTVTDDIRLEGHNIGAIKLCALRVTEGARARILKAGGEVLTFDQLALLSPKGSNTVLLRGRKNARTATKHFGAPGTPNSTARPHVRSEGRKFERARGRRRSCGFKV